MTTLTVPTDLADALDGASRRLLRGRVKGDPDDPDVRTDGATWDHSTDPPTVTYRPPLTADEERTLREALAGLRSGIDPAILAARRADLTALRAYVAIASPTAAQTAAATKAIIRVVGMLLRDDE
ncbi:MAG: hypothetical protein KF809_17295 [Chloroflexi bacterium]|nr:hypothetical protein [Chloroflexota bacterium]